MQLCILVSDVKKDYEIFAQTRNVISAFTFHLLKEMLSARKDSPYSKSKTGLCKEQQLFCHFSSDNLLLSFW